MVEIIMPKAGMAMEEGTVIRWLKKEGDAVESGEPILEIETDKVSMEVEAMGSGVLLKTLAGEGDVIPVTQVIGYIGKKGEKVPDAAPAKPAAADDENKEAPAGAQQQAPAPSAPAAPAADADASGKIAATPKAKRLAQESGIPLGNISPAQGGAIHAADVLAARSGATPLARKMAQEQGIAISGVQGTGLQGKVFSTDLQTAARVLPTTQTDRTDETVQLTGMRKVIATRMTQSHTEIPPVTLNTVANATDMMELRQKMNAPGEIKLTVNDFVLRAAALAIAKYPQINSSYADGSIERHAAINIGMAVALEDGLIVPVIRNADALSVTELSQASKVLSTKAKAGALLPDEYVGGTFTVSNLGMFGITSFTPIINQPEAGILGVCAIEEKYVRTQSGEGQWQQFIGLSLTFDHRVVDGAQASILLKAIVEYIENPFSLLK